MIHKRLEGTTNALETILGVKEIPQLELRTPDSLEHRNVNNPTRNLPGEEQTYHFNCIAIRGLGGVCNIEVERDADHRASHDRRQFRLVMADGLHPLKV